MPADSPLRGASGTTPAPDSAYVLHYVGEGRFRLWYGGSLLESDPFWTDGEVGLARERLSRRAATQYWLDAETVDGVRGWVLAEEGAVAAENDRDPSAPWCPQAGA